MTLLLAWSTPHRSTAQGSVHFADENLKTAVEDALWMFDPEPSDMLSLRSFSCIKKGIKDITGLEYAENLQTLWLTDNQITDISPLSGMHSMRTLVLNNNQISDISHLTGMHSLEYLDLHENRLTDISALTGLDSLQVLILRINQISDVSPLAGLIGLRHLDLRFNELSDISALAGLRDVEELYLRGNHIQDVSALAQLTALTHLYLGYNNINTIDVLSEHVNLRDLYLQGNQISDISPLLGLAKLQTLDLRWNPLERDFFCSDLNMIIHNNPDISCFYDGECDISTPSDLIPRVSRDPAADITVSSAVLQASVLDDGAETCAGRFRYWISGQDETTTPWQDMLHTGSVFSQDIGDLQSDTLYRFVAEVKNTAGTTVSDTGSFTTLKEAWVLTVLSGPGGTVIDPGEGDFVMDQGTSLPITAQPTGTHGVFSGWIGTAVDAGAVADPQAASTHVQVTGNFTLQANFLAYVIYVDDNAPSDPWPYDTQRGDPQEDGTAEHPFDAIQEAIASAPYGALIQVRPGSYAEAIDLLGKTICVTGLGDDEITDLPMVVGDGINPTVTFAQGEEVQCQLSGFVLTGGRGPAVIVCQGSSPTLRNCLIVGNRCDGPDGAIIACQDSSPVFANLTVHSNDAGPDGAAFRFVHSRATITNSILWANQPREIWVESGDEPIVAYCNIMGTWPGQGNMEIDPHFARPGVWTTGPSTPQDIWVSGDYHLLSQSGRWDTVGRIWLTDALTSPCIDAGDPDEPYGQEPIPNGKRINMGAYAGTGQASRSAVPILAHWRFDETSGATASDSVGHSDGTVHGTVWTSGKVKGALHFDGIDDLGPVRK